LVVIATYRVPILCDVASLNVIYHFVNRPARYDASEPGMSAVT
jgi:hypothetical protein